MKTFDLTIRTKITMLAVVGILFLALVGGVTINGIFTLVGTSNSAVDNDTTMFKLFKTNADVRSKFQRQVQEWKDTLLRGNEPDLYAKYHDAFEKNYAEVQAGLVQMRNLANDPVLSTLIGVNDVDALIKLHVDLHQQYTEALKSFNPAHPTAGQEVDILVRGIDRPFTAALSKLGDSIEVASGKVVAVAKTEVSEESIRTQWVSISAFVLSVLLLIALGVIITRGIIRKLNSFHKTISEINQGDFSVRAEIVGNDELTRLAKAFNELLDSRVATLANIKKENDQLNESVLKLLLAVAALSRKDLTIKIPVFEDVTGALADALNLFSQETAKTLQNVSDISADVTSASIKVQQQASSMLLAAADERVEVDNAAHTLSIAANALNEIAVLARQCNAAADTASQTTQSALSAVNNTVTGINSTRDVIRETGKRIKRLGERSQEISGVVNLINVIAERTHILALNASMHAASAGEAGRGFAVVADEVQRLAENARQATQQISALVNNIQIETADTVSTMNDAITQIVEGSKLAEQAGQQMHMTQQSTAQLVASVKQIAISSEEQAKAGQEFVSRAETLKKSNTQASERLQEQSAHTNSLVEYAKQLLMTVRVFKLPG
jgi:methyl-accepting chemotaxis protein